MIHYLFSSLVLSILKTYIYYVYIYKYIHIYVYIYIWLTQEKRPKNTDIGDSPTKMVQTAHPTVKFTVNNPAYVLTDPPLPEFWMPTPKYELTIKDY